MRKPILFCFLFSLLITKLAAQTDFKPGYIVLLSGDTIFGYVNYQSNSFNQKNCEFKPSLTSETQHFKPGEINSYRIENLKMYTTKTLNVNEEHLTVFAEFLVDGIVDLFYYKDTKGEFYFIEKEGTLYPLTNEEREIIKNDVYYKHASNQYKGALNFLYSDAPAIKPKIIRLPFDYKSLIAITKDYHHMVCTTDECIDYTKSTVLKLHIEPVAGYVYSVMSLYTSKNKDVDYKPQIGVNLRIYPFKVKDSWNLSVGFNFTPNNFNQEFENTLYDGLTKFYRIKVNYVAMRMPVIANYVIPVKKIKPYIMVGFNPIILLNRNEECMRFAQFDLIGETIKYDISFVDSDFRILQIGFMGGLGVQYELTGKSHLFIQAVYDTQYPYANFSHLLDYIKVNSLLFQAGYSISIN